MGEFLNTIPVNEFVDFGDNGENLRRNSQIGKDLHPAYLKLLLIEGRDIETTKEFIKAMQEYKTLVVELQEEGGCY